MRAFVIFGGAGFIGTNLADRVARAGQRVRIVDNFSRPTSAINAAWLYRTLTVHVPRWPYRALLPGIPTIWMFEALACGIPLIAAPWRDLEGLFEAGVHYLTAQTTGQMARQMRMLVNDQSAARELAESGLKRVRERHTCAHRVDELIQIAGSLAAPAPLI